MNLCEVKRTIQIGARGHGHGYGVIAIHPFLMYYKDTNSQLIILSSYVSMSVLGFLLNVERCPVHAKYKA
jgi:hypothetical protein